MNGFWVLSRAIGESRRRISGAARLATSRAVGNGTLEFDENPSRPRQVMWAHPPVPIRYLTYHRALF